MADSKAEVQKIDETLTLRVADLARLELSEDEVRTFTPQLRDVIGYVEQLQEVDVSGVEPLTHPLEPGDSALREDRVEIFADLSTEGYRVPQIL
ncbi:MAG TPA: Asp-tRNA(Asn)/Glu-tRNA(Gln) amidotransferase subunit GatC [Bdellovibrionota bacterium]|nr:Asp-tRNA(Asn)/Glu-tRNA(Gln) amidotransferase subunit GatC [Bdellovibrionota bacterium]